MGIPRRGLRDIRTLSGTVSETSRPHRAYMKIACLEMEKIRRGKERSSARQRIADIDARLQEMEAEKAALLQALEGSNGGRPGGVPGLELKPAARPSTGGFKLRY